MVRFFHSSEKKANALFSKYGIDVEIGLDEAKRNTHTKQASSQRFASSSLHHVLCVLHAPILLTLFVQW